ncbi:YbaN family protein [Lacipirellula limnantheis]|uniref:Inner membrane protein YbaN n=1 Tax=Lacipirellula limnantheis TaxID=2528024 RepID=A0A517U0R6_9BACT|nr:YbaN family protein [Lacipirellula limnantheis]QDT74219.1 Inner membrane protein YbaN [Lacipirellula limnantheis]
MSTSLSSAALQSIRFSRELNDDVTRLRDMAAGILRRPGVRAVVIDRRELQATILPQRGRRKSDVAVLGIPVETAANDLSDVIEWHDSLGETLYCVRAERPARGWRRIALLALTVVALILALLGVVLPGLPTTPFVLAASYGLMRTSRRWHRRLLDSRLFGGVLRDWHLHRGISAPIRVKALVLLTVVVGATLLWPGGSLAVKSIVAIGGLLGGGYVWQLPTATRTYAGR